MKTGEGFGGRTTEPDYEVADTIRARFSFDALYLAKLRSGDVETARHFDRYFRRMLRIKLWSKTAHVGNDDLIDEVMAAAMEKILNGEPRSPENLVAYVRGICANLARKAPQSNVADLNFDHISDHALTAEEKLLAQERVRTVRAILVSLKPLDRNILLDLFYNDMARSEVCDKYGVTREQLRLILFRARARFQDKWLKN